MSTYTEKHRQYYQENKERIKSLRLERERAWIKTPKGRYSIQKRSAKKRGIAWELSFEEWWKLWEESGHWDDRGTGTSKYCICRLNDYGPYKIGNIRIDTNSTNGKESYMINGIDKLGRYQSKYKPK